MTYILYTEVDIVDCKYFEYNIIFEYVTRFTHYQNTNFTNGVILEYPWLRHT